MLITTLTADVFLNFIPKEGINYKMLDKSWQNKYQEIVKFSANIAKFSQALKVNSAIIPGCSVELWLYTKIIDYKYYFIFDCDAKIIKGLALLIISQVQGKTIDEIQCFDLDDYFKQLGLIEHIAPTRVNGLKNLVLKLKDKA